MLTEGLTEENLDVPDIEITTISSNDLGRNTVTFGNDIIRASQKLTLSQKRVVAACVSKLSPKMRSFPKAGVRLYASEYAETYGLDMTTAYEQLKGAADSLFEREWSFKSGKTRIRRRWVHEIVYHDGAAWLEVHFSPKIAPFMLQLTRSFTTYKLMQASAFRSASSWRLLEMFERFVDPKTGEGVWNVYVDEFCEVMEASPSLRVNFAHLNRRIIQPSVKELSEGWEIKLSNKKQGRKVNSLCFNYSRKPVNSQGSLDLSS